MRKNSSPGGNSQRNQGLVRFGKSKLADNRRHDTGCRNHGNGSGSLGNAYGAGNYISQHNCRKSEISHAVGQHLANPAVNQNLFKNSSRTRNKNNNSGGFQGFHAQVRKLASAGASLGSQPVKRHKYGNNQCHKRVAYESKENGDPAFFYHTGSDQCFRQRVAEYEDKRNAYDGTNKAEGGKG